MSTLAESYADLPTTRGPMRVHLFIPEGGARYPAVIFYSEIFQATGPIRRMAAALAGEGYLVAVPEVYHEFEPPGSVLAYDAEGSARGNSLKTEKEIASYDEDTDVTAKFLLGHDSCSGKIASFGVCLGGHLAMRAGLHSAVQAVAAGTWTTIASSAAGNPTQAVAGNFPVVTESAGSQITGIGVIRAVSVRDAQPVSANPRRMFRVKISHP